MNYLDTYLKKGEVFYINFFTKDGVFLSEETLDIMVDIIYDMNDRGYYLLFGFTLLPREVHLIVRPDKVKDIDKIVRGIKRRVSSQVKLKEKGLPSIWKREVSLQIIDTRDRLLSLLTYIHKLPLDAGFTYDKEGYRYSSSYPSNITDLDALW